MIELHQIPTIDAILNGTSAVLLTAGYWFIRRKQVTAHKTCMLTAFGVSILFLTCYLYYHVIANVGTTHFPYGGVLWIVYGSILFTHTVLAALIVPLVLVTLYRAFRGQFDRHRRIARWTWPLWLYVSVTGVVIYVMLYHL